MDFTPYEFKKTRLETDRRWSHTDRMVLFSVVLFTSACNLAIFASTFTIVNDTNSAIFTASSLVLRYISVVITALTLVVTVYLLVLPRNSYRFTWCFRENDPQDIMDDYMSSRMLEDNPTYSIPQNASLLWLKEHDVPPPTITYQELEDQMKEIQGMLHDKEEAWRFGKSDEESVVN